MSDPNSSQTQSAFDERELVAFTRDVTVEVLETMFFLSAAPIEPGQPGGDDPIGREEWLLAQVRFQGCPPGELSVALSRRLALSMGAAFLGLEPEEAGADEAVQVSGEFANMICGAVLSRFHPDTGLALSVPRVVPAQEVFEIGSGQWFDTPDGKLAVSISLESNTINSAVRD